MSRLKQYSLIGAVALAALACTSSYAGPLRALFGRQQGGQSGNPEVTAPGVTSTDYNGRKMYVFVPQNLPPKGSRALVVVLHGGLGSAERIEGGSGNEHAMSMDDAAQKYGFVVAYLNGLPVGPRFADRYAWNAGGGCCGAPFKDNTDDVGYISGAVNELVGQYGIDPHRVYGTGHSNGAMMTQRMMCETNVYAAAMVASGPLMTKSSGSCSNGRGKKIMAIHGEDDTNVPIGGGHGGGASDVAFNSEAQTQQVWSASGLNYQLDVVKGATHKVDELNSGLQSSEGVTISEKAARFFGLAH